MSVKLLILVVSSLCLICVNCKIRPKADLTITDGQGFVSYLEEGQSFGAIKKCWFSFQDDEETEIDLNTFDVIITERGEYVRKFSNFHCGIRVDNIGKASSGMWHLLAMNNSEVYANDSVKIRVLTAPKMTFNTVIEKPLGLNTISCTKQDYTRTCRIVESSKNETWDKCELFIKIHNESNFECRTVSWGSMIESVENISVRVASETEYSQGIVEETRDHVVLSCLMKSTPSQNCRAELPDRITQLYITDGLSNEKYSSYDTMLSQSKCSLEIQQPIEDYEYGLWKIYQHSESVGSLSTGTGCLFYVGTSTITKDSIIKKELQHLQDENATWPKFSYFQWSIHPEVKKILRESLLKKDKEVPLNVSQLRPRRIELYSTESTISEITCTVPFVVDDCYLKDSKNHIYFPDGGRFQRSRALGICTFINVPSIAGIWTCWMRGSDYKNEVVQDIEVVIESKLGRVVTGNVRIAQREPLELMCMSPFEEPISRCVYVSPKSKVYLVASTYGGTKMTGNVQYFGEGINKGFCGLRVNQMRADEFGEWTCHFQTVNNRAIVSNFTIIVEEMSSVLRSWYVIIGIGLVAVVIVILATGGITFAYKKFYQTTGNPNQEQVEIMDMAVRE